MTFTVYAEEIIEKPEAIESQEAIVSELPKLTKDPVSGIQVAGSSLRTTRIQDSLTRALLYLRNVARKDDTALFVPPRRQSSVSGYKEINEMCKMLWLFMSA